ncbi:cytochrome P450 [Cunninghamella echinulata]|nr:cytochrome P450 [Cunninghamella echinulata]
MLTQYINHFINNIDQKKTMDQIQKVASSKEGTIAIATAVGLMASISLYNNTKKFDHGCPRVPDSSLIYGSTKEYRKDPEAFINKWQKELGDVYSAFLFGEEIVILSGTQVREVFMNNKLNFLAAVKRIFDNYLLTNSVFTLDGDAQKIANLIKKYLNPNLKHFTPRVVENLTLGFKEYVGDIPAEGKEFSNIYPMVQSMVAKASASVFVGTELAKNEQLIDSFKNMVLEVGSELSPKPLLELFPRINRLRMWYIGKTSPKVRKHRQQLYDALKPEIDRRLENMRLNDSNWERPEDILQAMIESKDRPEHVDIYVYCSENITQLIFAALHTTSENSTIALYRILNHPGLIDELLEEQNEILEMEGFDKSCGPEVFTREIVNKFVKLDSAIRESLRVRNDYITLPHVNISQENVILSNGVIIRPGDSVFINLTSNHYDPYIQKTIDDLKAYNPLRFINAGKNATKIGDDFLIFGLGPRSCPGRWFAVQEIKTIISYIIRRFEVVALDEIKFPTGDRYFLPTGKFKLIPRK